MKVKKSMKKCIAMICVWAMVLSFIPAAWADGEIVEESPVVKAPAVVEAVAAAIRTPAIGARTNAGRCIASRRFVTST